VSPSSVISAVSAIPDFLPTSGTTPACKLTEESFDRRSASASFREFRG
jgi:hypothetical protein